MAMLKSGTTVNVGGESAPEIGTIPPGYQAIKDPETGNYRFEPIEGGPAQIERDEAQAAEDNAAGNATTSTDLVTTAAGFAREADGARFATGLFGQIAAINPQSHNAEINRQLGVLRGIAKTSNLQAMREASKTGGALGAVSAPELVMLEEMSGALDPASPNFARDLDNYERTLLRTIHGPEAGDKIYAQTRKNKPENDDKKRLKFNAETGEFE